MHWGRDGLHYLRRFAFVRRGRSWVPSPLAGEGQGEGKSGGNASTHPNEKCCKQQGGNMRRLPSSRHRSMATRAATTTTKQQGGNMRRLPPSCRRSMATRAAGITLSASLWVIVLLATLA